MKADEDTISRFPDIDLIAVAAQFERCPISFERILVRKFRSTAVTNDGEAFPTLGDASMARCRFSRRLGDNGRGEIRP